MGLLKLSFLHPPLEGPFVSFQFFTLVDKAAAWFCMCIILISVQQMPQSVIAMFQDKCIFSFFRPCQTLCQRDSTILHSYQHCASRPFSPHSHQHWVHVIIFLFNHSDRYIVIFFVLLICISLMDNDVEHLLCSYLPSTYPLW